MNKEENIFTQINDLEKYDKPLTNIYEKLIVPVMNEEVEGVEVVCFLLTSGGRED